MSYFRWIRGIKIEQRRGIRIEQIFFTLRA